MDCDRASADRLSDAPRHPLLPPSARQNRPIPLLACRAVELSSCRVVELGTGSEVLAVAVSSGANDPDLSTRRLTFE